MPLDLSSFSPSARTSYITLGRQFSSTETLNQANQTLRGLTAHGAELVQHGFGPDDAQQLQESRDAIRAAGDGRVEARNDKKVTSASFIAAMKDGKLARETGRSVLAGTRRALHNQSDAAAQAAVKAIDAALGATKLAEEEAEKLAGQLNTLRGVLVDTTVAAAAANRGGPQAVTDLQAKSTALGVVAAAHTGAPGTPVATEEMDLLDGLIVTLARQARKAAIGASKRLGKPALVADFELTQLYPARSGATAGKLAPAQPSVPNGADTPHADPPANPA